MRPQSAEATTFSLPTGSATVALARRLHDALAEQLQRHGAGAFTADWAALLTAIKEKAAKLTS